MTIAVTDRESDSHEEGRALRALADDSRAAAERRLAAYRTLLSHIDACLAASEGGCDSRTSAEFFQRLSQHVREVVPFDAFWVWRYDAANDMIQQRLFEAPRLAHLPLSEVPADFGPGGRTISAQRTTILRLGPQPAPPLAALLFSAGFRVMCMVPASTSDARWGLVGIASSDVDDYSPETIALLQGAATRIARVANGTTAVDRGLRTVPVASGLADHTQLLLRMTSTVTSQRHLPGVLTRISEMLADTIPHHYASLSIWDDTAKSLRRWATVQPGTTAPLLEGELLDRNEPPWLAFESGDVIEVRRESFDRLDTPATRALAARGVRSGVSLPLKTPRGTYGVLNVASSLADAFAIGDTMLLWHIARQLAVAIENAMYLDRAEQYRLEASAERDRFKLLLDVNNTLVTQLEARSLWSSVLETVRRALDHDFASLVVFDAATREMHLEAATYYDERGVLEPRVSTSLHQSLDVLARHGLAPCIFNGAELDRFDVEGIPGMRSAGLQCVCVVPLSTRRGLVGALNIARRREAAFSQPEVDLLRDVAGQVAIAVENTLAFREISNLKNRLAEEKLYLEGEISSEHHFTEIVGDSPTLKGVLRQIRTVAPTGATVLLLGETGTGKELLARALHDLSERRNQPFIRLNGAALPAGLIESELFGYEKGAFTGAMRSKTGRLELAHRGTLFLDEVGDIPPDVQPKLLRVLQDREFERLGSSRTLRVDVRLVAATNKNLEAMVAAASFRSDLYYRLNVFPVHLPSLKDRREDIPALVRHFTHKFSRALGRHVTTIPKATMDALQEWHWPGNIRELQNVIERAVILSTGSVLQVPHAAIQPVEKRETPVSPRFESQYRMGERAMILKALSESKGVIAGPTGAAARLGLKRTTLHSKMQKLGIKRQTY